ncbi:MAG: hypothetical protein ACM33T_13200 [Solirubrobacterales bacterium]
MSAFPRMIETTNDRAAIIGAPRAADIDVGRPVEHVILKDGLPFAIINATPVLAERTVAGFARVAPEAHWVLARP